MEDTSDTEDRHRRPQKQGKFEIFRVMRGTETKYQFRFAHSLKKVNFNKSSLTLVRRGVLPHLCQRPLTRRVANRGCAPASKRPMIELHSALEPYSAPLTMSATQDRTLATASRRKPLQPTYIAVVTASLCPGAASRKTRT